MLRSLFSGISGLRANQTMMDVVGNNIANVNTTGFKASNTVFQDTLSQLTQGASAPTGNRGGSNPAQVGLGVRVAAITTNFSTGAAQTTNRSSDLMIQGDGFFVEKLGTQQVYTRNGALGFDATGRLVGPDGGILQGWMADTSGNIDVNGLAGDLSIPISTTLPPVATSTVRLAGNIPANQPAGTPLRSTIDVFDAQGVARTLSATFTRSPGADGTAPATTAWSVTLDDGVATPTTTTLRFGSAGSTVTAPADGAIAYNGVSVDLTKLTGFAELSTLSVAERTGSAAGTLQGFSVGSDGVMTGTFSNGQTRSMGQLALATFSNPAGLVKTGASGYTVSTNSGVPQIGTALTGSRGSLSGGTLEMSNVDLAQEFTNLIVAQRGFQANSRIISAGDEMLQDLVNIKR